MHLHLFILFFEFCAAYDFDLFDATGGLACVPVFLGEFGSVGLNIGACNPVLSSVRGLVAGVGGVELRLEAVNLGYDRMPWQTEEFEHCGQRFLLIWKSSCLRWRTHVGRCGEMVRMVGGGPSQGNMFQNVLKTCFDFVLDVVFNRVNLCVK